MKKYYIAAAAFVIALAVVLLSRIPSMFVNPICAFAAKAALSACVVLVCQTRGTGLKALFAIGIPLFAWLMDVVEGQMAVAYALACIASMVIMERAAFAFPLKAALAAVAAAFTLAAYSSVLLSVRHEGTPMAVINYSFSRQILPCAAMFIGFMVGWFVYGRLERIRREDKPLNRDKS